MCIYKIPYLLTVKVLYVLTSIKIIFAQGKWQGRVDVAIKQLRNDRIEQGGYEKAKEEFFKEARIFKLMNHPNLVQVKSIFVVRYFDQSNII